MHARFKLNSEETTCDFTPVIVIVLLLFNFGNVHYEKMADSPANTYTQAKSS